MSKTLFTLVTALALMVPIAVQADVLVTYDFEGGFAGAAGSPTPAGVSFTDVSEDPAAPGGWGALSTVPTGGSQWYAFSAATISSTHFFEFTVTPGAEPITLSTLTMDAWARDNSNNNNAEAGANYRLALNGTDISTALGPIEPGGAGNPGEATSSLSFDLSALPPQTSPMNFRVYVENTGGSNGALSLRGVAVDNVVVNGTATAVPEPSSMALMAVVGVGMVINRRRNAAQVADSVSDAA